MVLTSIFISNIWGYIPKKQLITPSQPRKKFIEYIMHRYLEKTYYKLLLLLSALLSRESTHADGSKMGFVAEPSTGGWGAEPPHCKTFWQFYSLLSTFKLDIPRLNLRFRRNYCARIMCMLHSSKFWMCIHTSTCCTYLYLID